MGDSNYDRINSSQNAFASVIDVDGKQPKKVSIFFLKSFFLERKPPKRLESASVCQEKGFMRYLKREFPRGDVREVRRLLCGWNL